MFNFFAGPLSLIVVAWMVGPLSPLNHEITPTRVSVTESHEEPSNAILIATAAEPSHVADLAAASPALPSPPPTTEQPASPVEASPSTVVPPQVAEASASDHPRGAVVSAKRSRTDRSTSTIGSSRAATDKASEALRAEQLARLKSASAAAGAEGLTRGGAIDGS